MRRRADLRGLRRALRLVGFQPDLVLTMGIDAHVVGHLVSRRVGAAHVTNEHFALGPGAPTRMKMRSREARRRRCSRPTISHPSSVDAHGARPRGGPVSFSASFRWAALTHKLPTPFLTRRLRLCHAPPPMHTYPPALAEKIREIRGDWFDDEIRRETDPDHVEHYLRTALFSFCEQQDFDGARILDFGSGAGASTIVLSRLLPRASFVGVDLDERLVALARERSTHHGIKAEFYVSPSPSDLPEGLGVFDFVVLNAVWEHLLPDERPILLGKLLDVLRRGGMLFICETPHRWWPIEFHSYGLPLLNYMPAPVALRLARRIRGLPADISWPELLRGGVRGGTVREIRAAARSRAALVPPRQGSYGRMWYQTSPHRRLVRLKAILSRLGIIPAVTVALRKT
jgi:2-polyprenyl-3-methyl-5-hydroxy-6-metoxy-1,4-benzoquinol methylase